MAIQITKRDGTVEDFALDKISRVVQAAGLDESAADTLALAVQQEVLKSGHTNLSSLVIRDLVIGQLHHIDENAANLFTWYEKTKDLSTPEV